jgi:hypothetical protein
VKEKQKEREDQHPTKRQYPKVQTHRGGSQKERATESTQKDEKEKSNFAILKKHSPNFQYQKLEKKSLSPL